MFDPTQRDVDRDVESSMKLFQRAQVGEVPEIRPLQPENVLLALDGSSQDNLAVAFTRSLQERFGCAVRVLDAREQVESNRLADEVAESLGAVTLCKEQGESFDQILQGLREGHSDFLILPCPYARDLESVGPDSTGTVIDVLLARSPVPLLIVRKPFEPQRELFERVWIVITGENAAAPAAAAWAVGLVEPGGDCELLLLLQEEFYENVSALMEKVDPSVAVTPDALLEALTAAHARLHRSVQKAASQQQWHYRLQVKREAGVRSFFSDEDTEFPLLVLPLDRDDPALQAEIHNRIRFSRAPLLVVPNE